MKELPLTIPPWSLRRRLSTAAVISGFILLTASFIGLGIYRTSLNSGFIDKPLTKDSILEQLLKDSEFMKTMRRAARTRECINDLKGIRVNYQSPFKVISAKGDDACLRLTATHPTGKTSMVRLDYQKSSREDEVLTLAKEYSFVQSDFLNTSTYNTSVLTGIRDGMPTTHYVIESDPDSVWILSYQPTSPVLDDDVLAIAKNLSFY